MPVSQLKLNNWLLDSQDVAVSEFSKNNILVGFEDAKDGAWLMMKHQSSGFALRRFVGKPDEGVQAFEDAVEMMPSFVATVERVNKAYPDTRQVPLMDMDRHAVHCGDWTIDPLSPNFPYSHWAERSDESPAYFNRTYRDSALGVMNRACIYQEFLNQARDKEYVLSHLKETSTSLTITEHDSKFYKIPLESAPNDYKIESYYDTLHATIAGAPVPDCVKNHIFMAVQYSESNAAIEVFALGSIDNPNSGTTIYKQIELGRKAHIHNDGQVDMCEPNNPSEFLHWSFTEQELGLQPGQLQMMQFAEVSAFDTLTGKNPFQLSASEDYLGSLDGDVFTSQEQSRDGGMSL